MSEALIQVPQAAVATADAGNALIQAMAGSSAFLPRIQFLSGSSTKVKKKEFPSDHFAYITGKNKYDDLGEEFDCLVLAMRPKALDTSDPDGIITCFDPKIVDKKMTGLFANIAERSSVKDSGCMYGPEYLLWVPAKKAFATMFFCNPSLRLESANIQSKIGHPVTIGYQFIETKSHEYNSPEIRECTTVFDLPTQEAVNEECHKFLNPKVDASGVEIVSKEEADEAEEAGAGRPQ